MKKYFALLGLLLAFFGSNAQVFDADTTRQEDQAAIQKEEESQRNFFDRFFVGGNVGAQFGQVTNVVLAPMVGYKLTDRLSLGTRIQYQYINAKIPTPFSTHVWGGSLFSRYFVFDNFFTHVEYEAINGFFNPSVGDRVMIPHLFLGGGYIFRFNDNVGLGFTALYEVLQRTYSPYRNPIINAGLTVGL